METHITDTILRKEVVLPCGPYWMGDLSHLLDQHDGRIPSNEHGKVRCIFSGLNIVAVEMNVQSPGEYVILNGDDVVSAGRTSRISTKSGMLGLASLEWLGGHPAGDLVDFDHAVTVRSEDGILHLGNLIVLRN